MRKSVRERPIYALLALALFIASAVYLIAIGKADASWFVPMVVTSVPSLVAAVAAETAVRDIRNGVVKEKAKQGAAEAIAEQQVLTRTGPVVSAQVAALQRLLENIHDTTTVVEAKVDRVVAEQDRLSNGS